MLITSCSSSRGAKVGGLVSDQSADSYAASPSGQSGSTSSSGGGTAASSGSDTTFSQGQQPVAVSGINLVDYTNASLSCNYQPASQGVYTVSCVVMASGSGGTTAPATGVVAGVSLRWIAPVVSANSATLGTCALPATNALSFSCVVTAASAQTTPALSFGFSIQDPTHHSHTLLGSVNIGPWGGKPSSGQHTGTLGGFGFGSGSGAGVAAGAGSGSTGQTNTVADVGTTALQCAYDPASNTSDPNTYTANCTVVVTQSDQSTLPATSVAPGVTLTWSNAVVDTGLADASNCVAAAPNSLTAQCQVVTQDPNVTPVIEFDLDVNNGTNDSTVVSTFTMPFATGS